MQGQNEMQLWEQTRTPKKHRRKSCGYIHLSRWCPVYGKMCAVCGKSNHFKEVCKSGSSKMLHSIDSQEEQHQDEDNICKVNINSININSITLNSKCSVITANINAWSSQDKLGVPYKVDSGSDGNIIPLNILKKNYTLGPQKKQLAAMKNESIKLRTYDSSTIAQLGRCTVRKENNNKIKMGSFFVIPRNWQSLLSMPDIQILGILTINCNRIELKEADGPENCKTNTSWEIDATEEYYKTETMFQNLKMKISQWSLIMTIIT